MLRRGSLVSFLGLLEPKATCVDDLPLQHRHVLWLREIPKRIN